MIALDSSPVSAAVFAGHARPAEDEGHAFGHTANFVAFPVFVSVSVKEMNGAAWGV